MKTGILKLFFLTMVLGMILQGCSKDEIVTTETELRGGGDNGGGQGGNGGGQGGNGGGQGGNGGGPDGGQGGNGGGQGGNGACEVCDIESDVVHEWTELMLQLERYATGMRPNASARSFAYIYLASYETAVSGMPNQNSNEGQLDGLEIDESERPEDVNFELALNSCFASTLEHFIYNVPSDSQARIDQLETDLENEYGSNEDDETIEASIEWGEYVAQQIIEYSQTDLAAEAQILAPQPTSYEPPTGEGFWTYSADPERALFPYWGTVRTFVISPDETSTVPPIEYSEAVGSPYFDQMMECYTANNEAREEDGEELWIAEFWSDDVEGLMFSPPARQYAISNQLIRRFDVNLAKTLTMYLKLGFSLNDAAVATWKYKYDYMVMRPNVYIHEFIDEDFQTNLFRLVYWPNPSFPGYPSGHSTFASAAAGIFIDYFGNNTNFTDRSHEGRTEFRGAPRRFDSFRELAAENAFSRVPLGVHMRMDCEEGLRLGYEISDAVNKLDLFREEAILATN